MSIDTTFQPKTLTYLITTAALQIPEAGQVGATTFRVRLIVAGPAYLSWGSSSSVTAKGAPAAGTPVANTLGMSGLGTVMYIEVPPNSFFISNVATAFEITGGQGGVGG